MGFAAAGLILFYLSYRYMLLYTVQPKIDTKGHSYTLALQQLLTGVYLAELCLIGLFGAHKAKGPSIMLVILFMLTALFNAAMNKYLAPLEKFLPMDLVPEAENTEQTPLLAAVEEGEANESHLHRLGRRARLPNDVVDPIARFFQPHIFASHQAMKAWLRDGDFDENDVPEYDEDDLKKAYLNPVFTSPTPVVWVARDEIGTSKNEIEELEKAGLKASDEGAWLDEHGDLQWSFDDFDKVPIFKQGVKW